MHSADDWDDLLVPEIDRQQAEGTRVAFRADAAFAKPEIYDALETRDVDYVIRMPANKSVELEIEDLLFRPPGRPSRKPLVRYKSFRTRRRVGPRPDTQDDVVSFVSLHVLQVLYEEWLVERAW